MQGNNDILWQAMGLYLLPQAFYTNGKGSPQAINWVSIPGASWRSFSATWGWRNLLALFKVPGCSKSSYRETLLSKHPPILIFQSCIRWWLLWWAIAQNATLPRKSTRGCKIFLNNLFINKVYHSLIYLLCMESGERWQAQGFGVSVCDTLVTVLGEIHITNGAGKRF